MEAGRWWWLIIGWEREAGHSSSRGLVSVEKGVRMNVWLWMDLEMRVPSRYCEACDSLDPTSSCIFNPFFPPNLKFKLKTWNFKISPDIASLLANGNTNSCSVKTANQFIEHFQQNLWECPHWVLSTGGLLAYFCGLNM